MDPPTPLLQQATAPPEEFPELALGSEAFEDEEWAPGAGSDDDDGPAAVWVTHEQVHMSQPCCLAVNC